jgi:hypothetical protein
VPPAVFTLMTAALLAARDGRAPARPRRTQCANHRPPRTRNDEPPSTDVALLEAAPCLARRWRRRCGGRRSRHPGAELLPSADAAALSRGRPGHDAAPVALHAHGHDASAMASRPWSSPRGGRRLSAARERGHPHSGSTMIAGGARRRPGDARLLVNRGVSRGAGGGRWALRGVRIWPPRPRRARRRPRHNGATRSCSPPSEQRRGRRDADAGSGRGRTKPRGSTALWAASVRQHAVVGALARGTDRARTGAGRL